MITRTYKALTSRPVFVLAAALAILMLAAPFVFAATSVNYPENSMEPVATFSAMDQDGDAIVWSLSGRDEGDFTIDGGVLAFKSPPNYESPVSGATGTQSEKNVYTVTVEATGGSEDVTVTVTNVDEDGSASLNQYQPQVGRGLVASVSDPDSDETNQEWQWARGPSASGPFTDIDGATNPSRSPVEADAGMYLRASVTYTDSFGSGKTASVVSGRAVEDRTLANARPSFEGQDQTGPTTDDVVGGDIQDNIIVSRSVAENTAVGTAIGDPVAATDADGDALIYTLDWSPDLRTGDGDAANPSGDARFTIDRATGQIKVGKKLNYEAADDTPDKDEEVTATDLPLDATGGAIAATDDANNEMYVLRVRATDPSGSYGNVNVTITLRDANEAPTIPDTRQNDVTVVENTTALLQPGATADADPVDLVASSFVASDVDIVDDSAEAVVSYAVEGADAKYFSIGNDSTNTGTFGALSIDTDQDNDGTDEYMPNYEKQSSYSITIVAISGVDGRRLAGRLDVTIKVVNAEDRGSVELSQIEPQVGRPATATLKDEDGSVNVSTWQWQYAPLGGETSCQTVTTGWEDVPRATSASYTPSNFVTAGATVTIAGQCLRATATYTDGIDFEDSNVTPPHTEPDTAVEETDAVVQAERATNSAPKFPDQDLTTPGDQSDSTSRTVMENTAAGTNIGSAVTAGDSDGDLRLYTLGGADGDSFSVDRKTGQLKTKAALDFEALPADAKYHMVMVTATDPSSATDSIMVTIMVTDENDPASITGSTSVSYPENGTDPVVTLSAMDQDGDPIVWSRSGRDEGDFTIDGGVLRFKSSPNYESPVSGATGTQSEKNVYTVTVEATGGTHKVVVTVTNVDEDGTASLDQYQPQTGRSLVASVSDPDSDETNQEWQWARGPSASGPFTDIDGATNPSRSPVEADAEMYLRASVTYTDSFGSGKTASVVSDRPVEDRTLANARPSFEGQDQTGPTTDDVVGGDIQDNIIVSRSVAENTAVGTAIGDPIAATDADGDVLIYTLDWSPDLRTGDGDAANPSGDARFTIDRGTGQIKVGKKLNYEAADDTPDKDEATTLTADTGGGADAVDSGDAGAGANDEMYILRVRATDPSGSYGNVNVTITLRDANEAPTIPDTRQNDVTVVENTTALLQPGATADADPVDLVASSFVASDVDIVDDSAEAVVSYAVEGADAKYFSIGNDSTNTGTFGALSIDTDQDNDGTDEYMPNYEKQSSYSITIVAISGVDGRRLAGRLDVTIKVVNAEDRGSVELSQIEPQVGRPATATLKDEDGSVNVSTWQWQYAPLDGETSCQTVTTGWEDVPRATSASYTPSNFVTAGATVTIAGQCLRATATYTDGIDFEDSNVTPPHTEPDTAVEETDAVVQAELATNSAPKFPDQDLTTAGDQSDSTSRTVMENTAAGTNIGSAVSAGDSDGDLRLYTLGGSDGAMFSIDRKNGQIKTKAALDYEALPADAKYHMVMVTASDPSGATDSIMVTINVTDENDGATITLGPGPPPEPENNAPAFDDGSSTTRMVAENAAAGAYVGDPVTAMDADDDSLTYSLSGSMYFNVNDDGQIMTTAMLDDDVMPSHTVTVTADDGNGGTDSIEVTITVTDMQFGCTGSAAADCEALLEAKPKLEGDSSSRSLNWDVNTPIADWDGVRKLSDSGRVEWLYLHGSNANDEAGTLEMKLSGTIAVELGDLTELTRLYLHRNNLTGGIPESLSNLNKLVWLRLYDNMLSGGIPDLTGMGSLERLYLHENMLSGDIPMSLGGLDSLTHMLLQRNDLSGEIPAMLGDMSTLVWLGLYDNDLSGGIPTELGSLSSLERLYLHGNDLSGMVPGELGNLSALTNLWLNNNMLSGELPSELDSLTNLDRVRISGNTFTGCVPAALDTDNDDIADTGLEVCASGN